MHGDMFIGDEIIIAMLQHASSVLFHEVSVLDLEISDNFFEKPANDEGDDFMVNVCIKQGIVSGGTKTACQDVYI